MHELIKAYRRQKGEWDALREQRIYRSISKRRAAQSDKRKRYGIIGGVGIAAAAMVAVVIGIVGDKSHPEKEIEQSRPIPVAQDNGTKPAPADTPENASILTLATAGQVTLMNGAEVSIIEQQTDTVHLEQEDGQALYDIIHQEGRQVLVRAAGIDITVVGTLFLVTVDEPVVRIEVKHGVVRVNDGKQTITLESHETISVVIPTKAPLQSAKPTKNKRTG